MASKVLIAQYIGMKSSLINLKIGSESAQVSGSLRGVQSRYFDPGCYAKSITELVLNSHRVFRQKQYFG